MAPKHYYQDDFVTIYHGDCLTVMDSLESDSIDLILTDPPYNVTEINGRDGTTVGKLRRSDGTYRERSKNFGDWDRGYTPEKFLSHAERLLVNRGGLLAFTSDRLIGEYITGPLQHRRTLVWRKTNPAPQFPGNYQSSCEWIVWLSKNAPSKFRSGGATSNVLDFPIPSRKSHPCEKPVGLMERLLRVHSDAGDAALDPYAGSGSTLVAAKNLGRRVIGIEADERYCEVAARRCAQDVLDFTTL